MHLYSLWLYCLISIRTIKGIAYLHHNYLNGSLISIHSKNNMQQILSSQSLSSLLLSSNISTNVFHFNSELNETYKYLFIAEDLILQCIIIDHIKCSINQYPQESNNFIVYKKEWFVEDRLNTIPIKNSLSVKLIGLGYFIISWLSSNSFYYQIYDDSSIRLTANINLTLNGLNDNDPFISIDSFPLSNNIIFGYSNHSSGFITITSQYGKSIKMFNCFSSSRKSIYVKVIQEHHFIVCLRKNHPRNLCKIMSIEMQDHIKNNDESMTILTGGIFNAPSNVFQIASLNAGLFVLFWKRNDYELKAQLIDLNAIQKTKEIFITDSNNNKSMKQKISHLAIMNTEYNIIFIYTALIGKQSTTHYLIYDIGFYCTDGVIKIGNRNNLIIPFKQYLLSNDNVDETYVKIMRTSNNETFKIKKTNELLLLNTQYKSDEVIFIASLQYEYSIIIEWKGVNSQLRETNSCILNLTKPIQLNDTKKLRDFNKEEDVDQIEKGRKEQSLHFKLVPLINFFIWVIIGFLILKAMFVDYYNYIVLGSNSKEEDNTVILGNYLMKQILKHNLFNDNASVSYKALLKYLFKVSLCIYKCI